MQVIGNATLHTGDCLDVLLAMADNSVDSIVTDPPYGLSFMGKRWDYDVPSVAIWTECLRVLKPGGHLLAFAGTRTQHRMAVRIEDAGFEIRDMIAWVYGSGFPKSLDVSKAIDKAGGHWRGKAGIVVSDNAAMSGGNYERTPKGAPVTTAAAAWEGWGTALKPALEPLTMARKPLVGTVAANVQAFGTGALNVDGCRIAAADGYTENAVTQGVNTAQTSYAPAGVRRTFEPQPNGRWPANLIHDGSSEPQRLLRDAARFFYVAKATAEDRDDGVAGVAGVAGGMSGRRDGSMGSVTMRKNTHPTVKPTDLMRYLCRLVTPPRGIVLDPFSGSGSTGRAAVLEGFRYIGIELNPDYQTIAAARIAAVQRQGALFNQEAP